MAENSSTQNESTPRIIMGSLFIVVGVLALFGSVGAFDFGAFAASSWPLILVVAGLLVFLSDTKSWLWALILSVAGLVSFLNVNSIVSFDVWSIFWPIVIVLIGVSIIKRSSSKDMPNSVRDIDRSDQLVFMSGSEQRVVSRNYMGGKATAIMGGVGLDLRDAVIKDRATLEVFALMGGVDVKVPAGVIVRSEVLALLGGVEIKADPKAAKNAPILLITGTIALGGVEVKY
ncbi:hypothetical protein EOL73_04380 [Candidatus Saccharibacteria bacterium]|nr:hypothetical protein [Candidatus Saccharibacteria bacterium]NCU40962.1 hypothetical protein [Candidatus Saccharibacteria bacterium]